MIDSLDIPDEIKDKTYLYGCTKRTKRNFIGIMTTTTNTAFAIHTKDIEEYFSLINFNAPKELVDHIHIARSIGIEIEPMKQNTFRFYIGGWNSREKNSFIDRDTLPQYTNFPYTEIPDLTKYRYQGSGFFYDMTNDAFVGGYKHYYDLRDSELYVGQNYHFNMDGTFDYIGPEVQYDGKEDFKEELDNFGLYTVEYDIDYVKREDKDQKYLIAHRDYYDSKMYQPAVT